LLGLMKVIAAAALVLVGREFLPAGAGKFRAGAGKFFGGSGKPACRALVHWGSVFAQAAISGLFAALRTRHDAERSLVRMAAILAGPQ
jgi:hypothetical protein